MNTFFEEKFWGYAFVALAILSIIAIGFATINFEKNSNLCASNGGTMIETANGYACVKLEKVKLK
jgi:hypothetical protein